MMSKQRLLADNGTGALVVFLLSSLVPAKTPIQTQQVSSQSQPAAVSTTDSRPTLNQDADIHLGVGDLVEITVDKAPELSGTYRVNANGAFEMYFLGKVVALNKTPEDLRSFIIGGLRGKYLMAPRVAVVLKQRNSRPVYVNGAVRNAGVYQLDGRVTLLKLISLCGGLADNHGSVAFIFREAKVPVETNGSSPVGTESPESSSDNKGNAEPADYTFTPVNISGLLKGNLNENVIIESNDIVNIPIADLFFVAGEVKAPGPFPLKSGTTLRQAISLAQGTTIQAAKNRAMIFREDPSTGKRIDMKIDVGAVMDGKIEDIAIRANDVIIVPHSRLKSVGAALLQSLGLSSRTFFPYR